jgi:predicted MFS family arabinose efflux permease
MAGGYQCPKATAIAFGFGFAGFAGKALGGVLSDRLGWIKVGVATLLISAPLIAFGGSNYVLVTIGVFLVQMTMPVTLVALFALLPGRPAFAFGLSCLAYIAGAIPTFYHQVRAFYGPFAFLALMLLSAITLYAGLRMLREKVPMRFPSYNSQPPAARPFGGERN